MFNTMKKTTLSATLLIATTSLMAASNASANEFEPTPPSLIKQNIGPVSESDTLSESVMKILNLEDLEKAIVLADLAETLDSGEYTVFAPRDSAFWQLSKADYTKLKSDKAFATNVLLSHVVSGSVDAASLIEEIKAAPAGVVSKETLSGATIQFSLSDGYVQLVDETGTTSEVTTADLTQSNGVIHIINGVMGATTGTFDAASS